MIAKDFWCNKVEITVFLCNGRLVRSRSCADGGVTAGQRSDIQQALASNPEVRRLPRDPAAGLRALPGALSRTRATAKPSSTAEGPAGVVPGEPEGPRGLPGRRRAPVQGLPGVFSVQDPASCSSRCFKGLNGCKWSSSGSPACLLVAAVLQVANTIRLTAFSRRRRSASCGWSARRTSTSSCRSSWRSWSPRSSAPRWPRERWRSLRSLTGQAPHRHPGHPVDRLGRDAHHGADSARYLGRF